MAGFTDKELRLIELRTNGMKTPEAAQRMGINRHAAYNLLWTIYRKAGVDDVALLTRWAMVNGLDEPLAPERPEDLPKPQPKVFKGRIKLNRLKRAGVKRIRIPQMGLKPLTG